MARNIVVTGCDRNHFDLAADLVASLTAGGERSFDIGFIHVGGGAPPAEIAARVDRMVHIPDDDAAAARYGGLRLARLMVKPQIPDLFAGYETYVWLDGDTWVQNLAGVEQIIACAQHADVCAHPELDANYFRYSFPSDYTLYRLVELYGEAGRERFGRSTVFNAGVFGARAGSPLWTRWRAALEEVERRLAGRDERFHSDQIPLHRLIHTGEVSVHPLRAVNNWMVVLAWPQLDFATRRLRAPSFPFEEIHIVHLGGQVKDMAFQIAGTDMSVTFRYRDIQALFARFGAAT